MRKPRSGSFGVLSKAAGVSLLLGACIPVGRVDRGEPEPEPPQPPFMTGGGPGMRSAVGAGGAAGAGSAPGVVTGAPVSAAKAPPPISGGTLLVLADGVTAFAADPDRDALYLADLKAETLLASLPLQPGDEPGRAVEDGKGLVHVALRRGGAIVTVNARTRAITARRPICAVPRGIAYDARLDLLHVACAGGELLSISPTDTDPVRRAQLDRDLRDVVVKGDKLYVSLFRSAEVLVVSPADGAVLERRRPPGSRSASRVIMSSEGPIPAALVGVAWRMRPLPDGSVVVIHQESSNAELSTEMGGYAGGACKTPMGAAVTQVDAVPAPTTSAQLMFATLPVDFAYAPDGKRLAIVSAGNIGVSRNPGQRVAFMSTDQLQSSADCVSPQPPPPPPSTTGTPEVLEFRQPVGDPIAVAFDAAGRLVVQTREPARLEILTHRGGTIKLADESRFDTGHGIFHAATNNGLACASCHPEGGDDGRIWRFVRLGVRRTQNLRGGILQTAPFHWDGEMRDLTHLMQQVFTGRMSGPALTTDQVQALSKWMDRIPALPQARAAEEPAVTRGRALFNDSKVACSTCHTGALLTNNMTVDVGTGVARQVPSLRGVTWRAPFMASGCAKTLKDRFDGKCGGGDRHGVTSHLTAAQITDLIAYMESL